MWELTPFLNGAKLRQPTLFVAGERDGVISMYRDAFEALPQTVPGLRHRVLLPGAGHWIQQERPEEVNRLLVDFLRGLRRAAAVAEAGQTSSAQHRLFGGTVGAVAP
jgi:pimeloyl-ACP methyl ester carboxylesterase